MREQSCCFSGHRSIPYAVDGQLFQQLNDSVLHFNANMGITTFYAGGALGFDTLAAEAVLACRNQNPDIRLVIVIPCENQASRWSLESAKRYEHIKEAADEVICLSDHYYNGCMHERNRYLVDHSSVCICYLTGDTGGTAYTVKYARSKGLRIFNLAQLKGDNA